MPINTNLTHVVGDYLPLSGGTLTGNTTLLDNIKALFGTGADAEAYYDGTNFILNPRAVGTGHIRALVSSIGATPADALALWNATDAAAGAQQYSPAIRLHGEGWKTDATAASQNVDWRIYVVPVQGAANPAADLYFDSSVNDAAFTNRMLLTSGGALTVTGALTVGANQIVGSYLVFSQVTGPYITGPNGNDQFLYITGRDNTVGQVELMRWMGAADPYVQIGRDDTGVATNAVVDMFVLQAGAGTNNEAANFGLGLAVNMGNASSEVEKRGYLNWVITDATNASEDVRLDIGLMAGGSLNLVAQISSTGVLDVDDTSGLTAAVVGLFDDYDDALVLRQGISERKREVLERLGIMRRKNTGSGWMVSVQPMLYLLAGGVYQTRQMVDGVEERVVVLEEANRILKEQNARLLAKVGG